MDKQTIDTNQFLLTVPQAACILGISKAHCYQLCHGVSDFPILRVGKRRMMIPRDALYAWINAHIKR